MRPKALLGYACIAFLLFSVIKDPPGAAHLINNIHGFLSAAFRPFASIWRLL